MTRPITETPAWSNLLVPADGDDPSSMMFESCFMPLANRIAWLRSQANARTLPGQVIATAQNQAQTWNSLGWGNGNGFQPLTGPYGLTLTVPVGPNYVVLADLDLYVAATGVGIRIQYADSRSEDFTTSPPDVDSSKISTFNVRTRFVVPANMAVGIATVFPLVANTATNGGITIAASPAARPVIRAQVIAA